MTAVIIGTIGLLVGSFVNAAVWRTHLHEVKTKKYHHRKYSLFNGRSVCTNCHHQLAWYDLVPVLSWIWLRGKCRYCNKSISLQYPLVELMTAGLFILSYIKWDLISQLDYLQLGLWLVLLSGLLILAIYDVRWMILPDRVMKPLFAVAGLQIVTATIAGESSTLIYDHLVAVLLAGGFFFALFALSKGRWMGGGDVKLTLLMGLILGVRDILVALVLAFNVAAFSVLR